MIKIIKANIVECFGDEHKTACGLLTHLNIGLYEQQDYMFFGFYCDKWVKERGPWFKEDIYQLIKDCKSTGV